ncbi:mitochondrial fission ELM1 family protein [Haliea sp. E1-2-M8]|uniref:mitochondrial fission ELM1 family protein n=1 Tax=Haliea sp. E1-2-M8 TaxID=3064706 RepID=UPI002720AC95|nr:mitochondrial fission ELM1 family protein [Haliea sp. E1-2-M8]MDO8862956.1 mitochondrial fission ELM1 family protein [Haliea sp. E1-2-M8]
MTGCATPQVIWCLEDDRPGHQRQLAGLAQALRDLRPARICRVARKDSPAQLPAPGLILTAGRHSHWRGLRYRWRYGGKLIALMDPGLPRPLFDLCVVPEHDGLNPSRNVLLSLGPLNPVLPATGATADRGLILVGGPSRHFCWNDAHLAAQLQRLQIALPAVRWTLTTSRRTPASFLTLLRQQANPKLRLVPREETGPDWLLRHYARSGVIWVSEDSASMVYESLSCGAAVGVLTVPLRRPGRVSGGIQHLEQQGRVARLEELECLGTMPPPRPPLQEATRIAREINRRLD